MRAGRALAVLGVEPAAVIGHSAGELAAASIAGVFALEDGLTLAARRGQLLSQLPEGGAMAALFMGREEAERAIAPYADKVSIAAVNAHDSVVISGAAGGIDATLGDLARAGLQGHRLHISFAAHSPMVDCALDDMARAAADIPAQSPTVPVAWNLTGARRCPAGRRMQSIGAATCANRCALLMACPGCARRVTGCSWKSARTRYWRLWPRGIRTLWQRRNDRSISARCGATMTIGQSFRARRPGSS